MKLIRCLIGLVAIASLVLLNPAIAWAEGTASGAELFEVHCAGCHPNGGNIIRRGKTLKLRSLQRHHRDTVDAIVDIVTNGKSLMSPYRDRLTPEEIETVAMYVRSQAERDWK